MLFLAPWFLVGLLAAAIPLLLHLRRSRKRTTIRFSSVQFLDQAFLRAARRARIQQLLVMILRMAVLALLALALAQPLLRSGRLASFVGSAAPRQVVIVLDDSASMQLQTAAGVRFDQARQAALRVIDALSAARGDQASLILAGRRANGPAAVTAELTPDLTRVRQLIEAARPTDEGTDLYAAVRLAAQQLGVTIRDDAGVQVHSGSSSSVAREIHVVSDMQNPLGESPLVPATGSTVQLVFTPPEAPPPEAPEKSDVENVSLDAVGYASARPTRGLPFVLRGLVTNHGRNNAQPAIALEVEGKVVATQTLDVPAGRSRTVTFTHRFAQAGVQSGALRLDRAASVDLMDQLPADDARYFVLDVAPAMRIAAVNGSPSSLARRDELFYFKLAMQAVADAQVQVETLTAEQLTPERLAGVNVLVLANVGDLPDAAQAAVQRYVDQGGSLFITLGDQRRDGGRLFGPQQLHGGLAPGLLDMSADMPAEAGTPGAPEVRTLPTSSALPEVALETDSDAIGWFDAGHPALAGFATGTLGDLGAVEVARTAGLRQVDGQVLMRDGRGRPLLVEKAFGLGRVMLWTSTLDADWTRLPLHPTFLPLMHQLMAYLAQPRAASERFLATGDDLLLPGSATSDPQWQVTRPDGEVDFPTRLQQGDQTIWRLPALSQAGVYRMASNAGASAAAVNVPALESQLIFNDRAQTVAGLGDDAAWMWVEGETSAAAGVSGMGLWDQLLWIALAAALAEPWVANWLSRRRSDQT